MNFKMWHEKIKELILNNDNITLEKMLQDEFGDSSNKRPPAFLHDAIDCDNFEAFSLLLKYGADPNESKPNALGVLKPLFSLIQRKKDLNWIQILCNEFEKNKNFQTHSKYQNKNLTDFVALYGNKQTIDYILNKDFYLEKHPQDIPAADFFREFFSDLRTIDDLEIFKCLLSHSIFLEKFKILDSDSFVHAIWEIADQSIVFKDVEKLNEFMDICLNFHSIESKSDRLGANLLMRACSTENYNLVSYLIEHQCSLKELDSDGDSCAHWFFYGEHNSEEKRLKILDLLLKHHVDFEHKNNHEETAKDLLSSKINPSFDKYLSKILAHELSVKIPESQSEKKRKTKI